MSAKWDRFWDMCRPAPRAFTVPADAMWHCYGSDENDMRFTALREKWEAWIATEEAKLRAAYLATQILKIPNRLHGAAINAEGDAI